VVRQRSGWRDELVGVEAERDELAAVVRDVQRLDVGAAGRLGLAQLTWWLVTAWNVVAKLSQIRRQLAMTSSAAMSLPWLHRRRGRARCVW